MKPFKAMLLASAALIVTVTGAPQYVTSNTASGTSGSRSVNYPSGLQANDVAILVTTEESTSGTSTYTAPAGYTLIGTQAATDGTLVKMGVWYKRLDGTETGAVTIGVAGSSGVSWTTHVVIYRGCVTSGDPFESLVTQFLSTSSLPTASIGSPISNYASPDRTIVNCYAVFNNSTTPSGTAAGTGYTEREAATGGGIIRGAVHDHSMTTPGYTGETVTVTGSAKSFARITFALIPATTVSSAVAVLTDPYIGNVVFLYNGIGSNGDICIWEEMGNGLLSASRTTSGATVTTSQSKFGPASLNFIGANGRGFQAPDNNAFSFGSGPFTVEIWARFNAATNQALIGHWADNSVISNDEWFLFISGSTLTFRVSNASTTFDVSVAFTPTLSTWYHIAVDRDGTGKTRIYVAGAKVASGTNQNFSLNNSSGFLTLGSIGTTNNSPTLDMNGQIGGARITKGTARYATDTSFTPPAAVFPGS